MGDTFDLELPLLLADVGLDDGVLGQVLFEFTRHVSHDVTATKVQVFVNIIIAILSVHFIGKICITLHIITTVLGIIVALSTLFANDRLFELEAARKTCLSELQQDEGNALAIASLELVGADVHLDPQVLQLNQDVLARRDRIIILVPSTDLMLVDGKEP